MGLFNGIRLPFTNIQIVALNIERVIKTGAIVFVGNAGGEFDDLRLVKMLLELGK